VTEVIGAIEIGGTHVSVGPVDVERRLVGGSGARRVPIAPDGSRGELLAAILAAARGLALPEDARWGVAVPGPFDYERGISRIRGVRKLDGLFGVDLRGELVRELGLADGDKVRFLNDAHAFLLGEWWAGGAKSQARAMGVTLGTGLGSAFLVDGRLVLSGPDVPAQARLDLIPYRGRSVEDVISARGILAAYDVKGPGGVEKIARRAGQGEAPALAVFHSFGSALGEFLRPWLQRFRPGCLLFGGSLARAWDLFAEGFFEKCPEARSLERCSPAEHLEDAPLLGAALYASRAQSPSP
jgi:glucokinase